MHINISIEYNWVDQSSVELLLYKNKPRENSLHYPVVEVRSVIVCMKEWKLELLYNSVAPITKDLGALSMIV